MVVALCLPALVYGQIPSNTVSTFSSYSMYGLGELSTQGTIFTRSMGGAGVAMRSRSAINLLNPASYSVALRNGILFDFAFEGANYFANQTVNGEKYKSSFATGNIHDIAVQLPIAKGMGLGLSITPYSSSGYYLNKAGVTSTYDYASFINEGSGDVTEVKLGFGWEFLKGLSIGVAAQYYWGDLDREFKVEILNFGTSGYAVSTEGVDNTSISRLKGQVGLQWEVFSTRKQQLVVGATFDIGGELAPRYTRAVWGTSDEITYYTQNDTTTISIVMPRKLEFGASYSTEKLILAADYSYQAWSGGNETVDITSSGLQVAYTNVHQIRVGAEYTPNRFDVRHYFRRVGYRAGARYGGYQYTFAGEKIPQMAITAGAGFPINRIGISKIDLGFEWGRLGTNKVIESLGQGLVLENSFKISLGFTMFGDDYWFKRAKID